MPTRSPGVDRAGSWSPRQGGPPSCTVRRDALHCGALRCAGQPTYSRRPGAVYSTVGPSRAQLRQLHSLNVVVRDSKQGL
eukprot:scaffold4129_cov390-Prasinococcus_capsulatus_cf.AAC.4